LPDDLLRAKGKWSYKNLEPVAFYNEDPNTWIVSTEGQFKDKSLKEVIELAKQKANTIKVSIGVDTCPQFLVEDVELSSGAKFIKVPFQGGAPGVIAMLGGHIEIGGYYYNEYKSHVEAGKARVLGQAAAQRHPFLPNTPTFNEVLGVNHIIWSAWRYAAVPRGTLPERTKYLEEAILAALHDPDCIQEFDKLGCKVGMKYLDARQTAQEIERQYKVSRDFFSKTDRISK